MKALNQFIGRLAMGSFVALSLIINLHAQTKQPLQVGTFYSAKDPDLVPLPFNPHPELPAVEVEKGIFIVDDTSIPDTAEQVISRERRQAAAERALAIASNPILAQAAQQAAAEAARKAQAALEKRIMRNSPLGFMPMQSCKTARRQVSRSNYRKSRQT